MKLFPNVIDNCPVLFYASIMKHILKCQLTFLFILVLAVLFPVGNVFAKNITPTPTPAIIQYDLAYPGILPGNFLYKVKVFRDKVQLTMTTDPKKRIDLLLKQADKGILASAMLVDKQQWNLATETALKAEHKMTLLTPEISYMEEPIDQNFLKKLQTASLKHQEVFAKLRERVPTESQLVFSQVIEFSKRNQSEIEKYIEL